jgi:hypothetical protein
MPELDGDAQRVIVLDRRLRMKHRPDANPYIAGEERAARELAPTDLFRQLAGELHKAAITEKIRHSGTNGTKQSRTVPTPISKVAKIGP